MGSGSDTSTERAAQHRQDGEVLGDHEIIRLPASRYLTMSQVRKGRNAVAESLKEDIKANGLISQIHVARMSETTLSEYIDFVNKTWGGDVQLDSLLDRREPDGSYYLVVAGHSRMTAVRELVDEGHFSENVRVAANVHKVSSPGEILTIQLGENIHSTPPLERSAIAIVESYEWGLHKGDWSSPEEYLEKHKKVHGSLAAQAFAFANLPPDVRRYVLDGHVPYTAGIEIGKAAPTVRCGILMKLGLDEEQLAGNVELESQVQDIISQRLFVQTQHIITSRTNSTAAAKQVKAWHANLQREIEVRLAATGESDSLFDDIFDLASPEEQLRAMQRELRYEVEGLMRNYSRLPIDTVGEILTIGAHRVKPEFADKVMEDLRHNAGTAAGQLMSTKALGETVRLS